MNDNLKNFTLKNEERIALKWFLIIFYLVFLSFEAFYYYFYPTNVLEKPIELFENNLKILYYIFVMALLPVVFALTKKNKITFVKYFFFISYTLLTILYESVSYFGSGMEYKSGNLVEVFLLLFAPIFVNPLFYWTVSVGTIFKYLFIGILLQTGSVLFPISLLLVLSSLGFIILKRFQGFVIAKMASYDNQLAGIVKGIIATIELKDPYTRGHSERVAFYANSLAESTATFSKEELRLLRYACLLHDIGKVNIPDAILMKPGKLSKDEYEIIKTHPNVGAETINQVEGLGDSIGVIKYHHERWDGEGYPEQLKGDEIPYLARVVSIADAFDAMSSSRSYRAAMPVEEAYKRIVEGKGTQFDPDLVEQFKMVFPNWVEFHIKYNRSDILSSQNNIN